MNIILQSILNKILKSYIKNTENMDFSIYSNEIKLENIYL